MDEISSDKWTAVWDGILNRPFAYWRHAAYQNTPPDHSWIKLYVNIHVYLLKILALSSSSFAKKKIFYIERLMPTIEHLIGKARNQFLLCVFAQGFLSLCFMHFRFIFCPWRPIFAWVCLCWHSQKSETLTVLQKKKKKKKKKKKRMTCPS